MVGRYCRLDLEPAIHAAALYEAYAGNDSGWTYLTCGPFHSLESYRDWMDSVYAADDPMFFAILNHGKPVGVASYMRITPSVGSIEVGHVNFSPARASVNSCHRGHVSDDGHGVPTGLPPIRMEM